MRDAVEASECHFALFYIFSLEQMMAEAKRTIPADVSSSRLIGKVSLSRTLELLTLTENIFSSILNLKKKIKMRI